MNQITASKRENFFLAVLKFFYAPFLVIHAHKAILRKTTLTDLKHQYAGSVLGLLWVVLGPLFLLSIYAFIYTIVLKVRPSDLETLPYVIFIFSGLIPFLCFSSALLQGTSSLSTNKQLLLNTLFPCELLPLKTVLTNSVVLIVGMGIIIPTSFLVVGFSWTALLTPIPALLLILFVTGLTWLLSLLHLVAKDIQQLLSYVMTLLLIVSPIAYTESMIPSAMRLVIYLNPFSYFVLFFQSLVVFHTFPEPWIIAVCITQSLLMFCLGFYVFQKAKSVFYDFV